MKIFEKVTTHLCWLGIFQWDPTLKSKYLSIFSSIFSFAIILIYVISSSWFLLFETKSPIQQSESVISALFSVAFFISFSIFLWKANKYDEFINELNEIIKKSMEYLTFFRILKKTFKTVSIIIYNFFNL